MERDTANGLAGAGSLLAAASLALPWYSITVSDQLAAQVPGGTPSLGHQSGWNALGSMHWVVLALAILAGLRDKLVPNPALPGIAAGALLLVIGWRYLDPPSLTNALPTASDPLSNAFQSALVDEFAKQVGLGYSAAYGLFFAAAGAAAAGYAALNRG